MKTIYEHSYIEAPVEYIKKEVTPEYHNQLKSILSRYTLSSTKVIGDFCGGVPTELRSYSKEVEFITPFLSCEDGNHWLFSVKPRRKIEVINGELNTWHVVPDVMIVDLDCIYKYEKYNRELFADNDLFPDFYQDFFITQHGINKSVIKTLSTYCHHLIVLN